jgi:hypothetical protein
MNNRSVRLILDNCRSELISIQSLLSGLGDGALPTPYVKKYAVIRATGAIETSFKTIIADKVDRGSHIQVKNFIKRKVRDSSCNPSMGMIESMLCEFDKRWKEKFDELLALEDRPTLKGALTELVKARNDFAHGGDPSIDIETTIGCFDKGVTVLTILDEVVSYDFESE